MQRKKKFDLAGKLRTKDNGDSSETFCVQSGNYRKEPISEIKYG